MGIYIKDMEMPKNCLECVFYRSTSSTYDYCCISTVEPKGYIPEDCPLVEEKTGKWIKHAENFYACSVCSAVVHTNFNYCPNCGARMVNDENL